MDGNGINTMRAHESRAGVDATYTRELIESYTFATYAIVTKYSNGRVDALCGSLKFTNIEVLVFGVNGWGIKPVPAVGDRVLLISSQSPIVDIKTFLASGTMPPYDVSGLKAIPVCDDVKAAQLITVSADKVEITGTNKITVDANGVQITDANGNNVTTNSTGISIQDKSENTVVTENKKITLTVKGGSVVAMSDSSVVINDNLEIKKS